MIYTLSINQEKCLEWEITLTQGALIDAINRASSWARPKIVEGVKYFWVSRNKLLDEIPLAYGKADTIYRAFKTLVKKGLITYVKEGRNDMVCLTEKGKTWNVKGTLIGDAMLEEKSVKSPKNTNSEINPSKVGNKSELKSEINPTDNTTIYKTSINNNLAEKKLSQEDKKVNEITQQEKDEMRTPEQIKQDALDMIKNKPARKVPTGLVAIWEHFYYESTDGKKYESISGQTGGQLKRIRDEVGEDVYPELVKHTLHNWGEFSMRVYKKAGLHNRPTEADIGFMSRHTHKALEFYLESKETPSVSTETSSDSSELTFPSWFKE